MAVAACVRGTAEVSVHTLVSGVAGYAAFALATTIDPVLGATYGVADTLIRNVVSKIFAFIEQSARNANQPQVASFLRRVGDWEQVVISLVVASVCLGSLVAIETVCLLQLAHIASLIFSSCIIAAISS